MEAAMKLIWYSACARYHEDCWVDLLYKNGGPMENSQQSYTLYDEFRGLAEEAAHELKKYSDPLGMIKSYCTDHNIPYDPNDIAPLGRSVWVAYTETREHIGLP